MKLLTIDTTTSTLTLGLFEDGHLLATYEKESKNDHASILMPGIEYLLKQHDINVSELQQIIVANGPGSYTGTRIGVTTAKTLGWSLEIPVQAVSSLYMYGVSSQAFNGFIAPLIDARRQSVYTALYQVKNKKVLEVEEEQFATLTDWFNLLQQLNDKVLVISPTMDKLEDLIPKEAKWEIKSASPSAQALFDAAQMQTQMGSVHEIVPNYIRITEAERNLLTKQNEAKRND